MKNKLSCLLALLIFLSVTGCIPRDYLLENMQKHSQSLYTYKALPSDKTLAAHKKVLLGVIESSKNHNMLVPPGIYAEYGYYLLKENQLGEAEKYFLLEKGIYPESGVFMDRMIQSIEGHESVSNEIKEGGDF
ncbi:MAG: hypothetical protein ACI9S8_002552 [Chlamydiales bacterium]|jgi:hypothetical protein